MTFSLETIHARCEEFGECTRWQGPMANGSPIIHKDGAYFTTRRIVHELTTGMPVPKTLHPVMKCRDPRCLTFEHMSLLTTRQVAQLAAKEGKFSTPARRAAITAGTRAGPNAKLDRETAREIFHSPESGPALARRYGIHRTLVNRIKRGLAWREGVANSSIFNAA